MPCHFAGSEDATAAGSSRLADKLNPFSDPALLDRITRCRSPHLGGGQQPGLEIFLIDVHFSLVAVVVGFVIL